MNKAVFVKKYRDHFGKKNKYQIVVSMDERFKGKAKVVQVMKRFNQVANIIFSDKEIWVLLIIWDAYRGTMEDLTNCGFKYPEIYIKGDYDDELLNTQLFDKEALKESEFFYLRYSKYAFEQIAPIVCAIAGYELGLERSANISAYFINFDDTPILLNLYDDRGLELVTDSKENFNKILQELNLAKVHALKKNVY